MALVTFSKLAYELKQRSASYLKQVKFAAAKALTDCGYIATGDVAMAYSKSFHVRNKSFGKALWVREATPNILMSSVYYKNDFMEIHTKGGTRRPTQGREALSVPIYENDRRMENGKTRARDRVPSLLKYANQHPTKQKQKSGVKKPFILRTDGKAFVVKRAKGNTRREDRHRNNGDLFLFRLKKDAKVEARWDFDQIVKESVDKNLETRYNERLKWALANAKG